MLYYNKLSIYIYIMFGLLFLNPVDVENYFLKDLMLVCFNDNKLKSYNNFLTDT